MSNISLQTSLGTRSESFNVTLEYDATILDIHRKLSKRSAAYILLSASVSRSFFLKLISGRKGQQQQGYSSARTPRVVLCSLARCMSSVAPAKGDPACLFWAATIPDGLHARTLSSTSMTCCSSRSSSPCLDVNGQINRKCLKARDSLNR